jgi:hypothetical protein
MNRYGNPNPEGDDRPPSTRDRTAHDDEVAQHLEVVRSNMLMGSWTLSPCEQSNFGQGIEALIVLAALAIKGLFLLVTWPIRWAWRRRSR